jgi:hypothetical protein
LAPLAKSIENALTLCRDQQSFFQELLRKTLDWPIGKAGQIEEIAYSWSAGELNAVGIEVDLLKGRAWQIQPLEQDQPWGIFVLEFKRPDALSGRRGMAGILRKILRGLVGSRRKQADLPSWKRDHLLFICTHDWRSYRFAYFRSKFGDQRGSRLTTFGWEPDTSPRTVCEFNLPALKWPDDPTKTEQWITEWAKAFDKERLTNDFFKRFDEALDRVRSDLVECHKFDSGHAYTQAQLLLERLIFLYFLQNRGWLDRDRRYLPSRLGEHLPKPEGFSYYRDFLDKVFWTLSSAPGSSGRLPGIPFLNGGLFDDDEFAQPGDQRKANPPLKVRNKTFQFVFQELLEAFNFTVTEDTPLNQEVAVDPEMLGKVFESIVLHAEQADPEATAPDKRKATGSYYTPRIVVHFICQEVLYQYLLNHLPGESWGPKLRTLLAMDATDGFDDEEVEKLKQTITPAQAIQIRDLVVPLKCCDPAVGSGAFPVGLMHELVNLRRTLETAANGYVDPARGEGSNWLQKTKEDIVQNCLFGVDIQQQAIEICRLRLWLSLVVDYDLGLDPFEADKTQFNRAIEGISQLPNLEMNFHRGDSLHDHISGVPIVVMPEKASRHGEAFQAIAKLGDRLHRAKKAEQKRKLRLEILTKRLDLSRKIIDEELRVLDTKDSSLDKLFHDETDSASAKRERISHEKKQLQEALAKIEKDRKELDRLSQREFDNQFYVKLRKLEGADFDSPFNFAWYIDFPGAFAGKNGSKGGFDIVVGNPPFVTARNPKKRELWRERWPRVCSGTYQMLCPFFDLSFGLLKARGQLGFIVSNAFATREFGIPLVTVLFPERQIQKIVDCSGLSFPGHGTPTWLVFAAAWQTPKPIETRTVSIVPGGGDLRTPPEESPLWQSISAQSENPGYSDEYIAVDNWNTQELLRWPLNLDRRAYQLQLKLEESSPRSLGSEISGSVGRICFTGADDVYFVPMHMARRFSIEIDALARFVLGEGMRNWTHDETGCICPYGADGRLLSESKVPHLLGYLRNWRSFLKKRLSYEQTQEERGLAWWEYSIVFRERITGKLTISIVEIATHNHSEAIAKPFIANRSNPIFDLGASKRDENYHLMVSILNSATALFWLKQVCYNKGAGEDEQRDRFEYAGGKVQQLPVPKAIVEALHGSGNSFATKLTTLSQACWERGQQMPALALRRLFQKPGEAHQGWNSELAGHVVPSEKLGAPFDSTEALSEAYRRAQAIRERLRAEMIALQEEMDWLVYAAYGLLPEEHPAVQGEMPPGPLDREQRSSRFWPQAEEDFAHAVNLIPTDWPASRKRLWEARLATIRDNEHIRRIEQPVYKRRWDEQWKVGNQWRCGPIAYAAEFVEAFEWWLREKAEWWLEHKKGGGPAEFDEWAQALWKDSRVQAAWPVTAEEYARLEYEKVREKAEEDDEPAPTPAPPSADFSSFKKAFRDIVDEETVPEGFPFGTPYDELEKKLKKPVPGKLHKVRGKLNVPRERFHLRGKTQYLWAGLQFK